MPDRTGQTESCQRLPVAALITPPPSGGIVPKDPVSDVSTLLLPPAATSDSNFSAEFKAASDGHTRGRLAHSKLPPPPMRSRRIIQMQPVLPKPTDAKQQPQSESTPSPPPTSKGRRRNFASASTRKTARKIAHSAIERRRRSKMNEEFDSLKNMVPACRVASQNHTESNLHKLGILQATVEYVRYLEGCIGQLQARLETLEDGRDSSPTLADQTRSNEQCETINDFKRVDEWDEGDADYESNEGTRELRNVDSDGSSFDDEDMEEAGKEVSRTLLMLRQVSDISPGLKLDNSRSAIRVCDLLG